MLSTIRILCLGNDLLADDAFGTVVAERLKALRLDVDVVVTAATGFGLLDDLLDASRLAVVDVVRTEHAAPGTVYVLREEDMRTAAGGSPHYVGLFEMLALSRALHLPVPQEVVILAVEAADCTTVGAAMDPAVQAALPAVVGRVASTVREWRRVAARRPSAEEYTGMTCTNWR